ncbi:MAG: hypothetical protein Q9159_005659 [Coniocarpon cinnabarinum]
MNPTVSVREVCKPNSAVPSNGQQQDVSVFEVLFDADTELREISQQHTNITDSLEPAFCNVSAMDVHAAKEAYIFHEKKTRYHAVQLLRHFETYSINKNVHEGICLHKQSPGQRCGDSTTSVMQFLAQIAIEESVLCSDPSSETKEDEGDEVTEEGSHEHGNAPPSSVCDDSSDDEEEEYRGRGRDRHRRGRSRKMQKIGRGFVIPEAVVTQHYDFVIPKIVITEAPDESF